MRAAPITERKVRSLSEERYLIIIHPDIRTEIVKVDAVHPSYTDMIGGDVFSCRCAMIPFTDVVLVLDANAYRDGKAFNPFATFLRGFSDSPIYGSVVISQCTHVPYRLKPFIHEGFKIIYEFIERLRSYYLNLDRLVLNKVIKS